MKIKYINYTILLFIIITLPYTNFPYLSAGTIKPLALTGLLVYFLFNFNHLFKKRYFIEFSLIFIFFCIYDLFITINIDEYYLNLKPYRNQFIGLLQFMILCYLSFIAYYIGRWEILKYINAKKIVFFTLLAFYPSLIFGFIHTLLIAIGLENPFFFLRDIFTSTEFSPDYYRNVMLTTEPSFVAVDLIAIVFTLTLLQYQYNKLLSFFTIFLLMVNLIGAKSGLGVILASATMLYLLYMYMSNIKRLLLVIPVLIISFVLFLNFNATMVDRVYGALSSVYKKDYIVDESTATRLVSYDIAINIIIDHPFGVGYSNEGYYYPLYLDEKYYKYGLFSDWIDPNSKRFPDIKSTILKLIAGFGITTIFIVLYLLNNILRFKVYNNYYLSTRNLFLLNLFITSFSISLVGYVSLWFLLGLLNSIIDSSNFANRVIIHQLERKNLQNEK